MKYTSCDFLPIHISATNIKMAPSDTYSEVNKPGNLQNSKPGPPPISTVISLDLGILFSLCRNTIPISSRLLE